MVTVTVQETPNPAARRFVLDRTVQQSGRGQSHVAGDEVEEPLVAGVLSVAGVMAVLTLPSSLTVTKATDGNWEQLVDKITTVIKSHFD